MSIDLRLPNITANTDSGKINQLQSYVYQLVEQLNWAINIVNDGNTVAQTDSIEQVGNASSEDEAVKNFQSIKSLIIKSADIVNAYYDVLKTQFDGQYLAQSDFGIYQQETSQLITQNSTEIMQQFTDYQELRSEVSSILESNAWIRTGLLDYKEDGTPIYGMEIGQKTDADGEERFNKYSRFTSEGTYFYLPGSTVPVAWMTGTKLFINRMHVVSSVQLGDYLIDCTDGIVFS